MARETDPTSLTNRLKGAPTQARQLIGKGKEVSLPGREPAEPEPEPAPVYGMMRAEVFANDDPDGLGRVEVMLPESLGFGEQLAWCPVVAAGAGDQRGIWFRPEIGDEVVIAFEEGDPDRPLVIGGLWRHSSDAPVSGDDDNDRRGLYSRAGSSIEFDDDDSSITIRTAGGFEIVLDDEEAECRIVDGGGSTIKMHSSGISIESPLSVEVTAAATLDLNASIVSINTGLANFTGMVKATTLQADSVIASSYTPGVGNIH